MERPRLAGIIGKGDRVEKAIQPVVAFGKLAGKAFDLVFVFHIAHEHGCIANELLHLLATGLAPHRVNNFGPRLDQYAARVPGNALAIGNTHHEDAFVGELKEVSGHEFSERAGLLNAMYAKFNVYSSISAMPIVSCQLSSGWRGHFAGEVEETAGLSSVTLWRP